MTWYQTPTLAFCQLFLQQEPSKAPVDSNLLDEGSDCSTALGEVRRDLMLPRFQSGDLTVAHVHLQLRAAAAEEILRWLTENHLNVAGDPSADPMLMEDLDIGHEDGAVVGIFLLPLEPRDREIIRRRVQGVSYMRSDLIHQLERVRQDALTMELALFYDPKVVMSGETLERYVEFLPDTKRESILAQAESGDMTVASLYQAILTPE